MRGLIYNLKVFTICTYIHYSMLSIILVVMYEHIPAYAKAIKAKYIRVILSNVLVNIIPSIPNANTKVRDNTIITRADSTKQKLRKNVSISAVSYALQRFGLRVY